MNIIYEPRGRDREYCPWAANLYLNCPHECVYCFGPAVLKKNKQVFHGPVQPKKNALDRLKKDAFKLKGDTREILLSFVTDPYQPAEMDLCLTRQAIQILMDYDLYFTILTKGGMRVERDFDLLERYDKARFGTTLVFTSQADADKWEPYAPSIDDRIITIKHAHDRGIKTWVSLEPVIIPEQAMELIRELHPIVDHWKIGKLNYRNLPVDWIPFREEVQALLDSLGADYYLKRSLTDL
jgi:DNA repair photolyase